MTYKTRQPLNPERAAWTLTRFDFAKIRVQGRYASLQVLCAALSSWSTFARQHARLRTIVVRIVHRDMAAALLSWRDYVRRMAGARALLRRVVMSQKQLCWDTWWQYATQVRHIGDDCFRRRLRQTCRLHAETR